MNSPRVHFLVVLHSCMGKKYLCDSEKYIFFFYFLFITKFPYYHFYYYLFLCVIYMYVHVPHSNFISTNKKYKKYDIFYINLK